MDFLQDANCLLLFIHFLELRHCLIFNRTMYKDHTKTGILLCMFVLGISRDQYLSLC